MSLGTVQNVLVCVPVPSSDQSSGTDQQLCPSTSGQYFHLQSQQAYVLSPDSAGYVDSVAQPFDYVAGVGFWSLAFTMIVGIWMVSSSAGAILDFIRRA